MGMMDRMMELMIGRMSKEEKADFVAKVVEKNQDLR